MTTKVFQRLVLSIVILLSGCYEQKRDCDKFVEGTFMSEVVIDNVVYKSKFNRTTNLQIEAFNNVTDSASVRWINPCEYVLSTINPKNRSEEKPVLIKILSTTDDSYTFEYNFVGESLKQTGTATKVD